MMMPANAKLGCPLLSPDTPEETCQTGHHSLQQMQTLLQEVASAARGKTCHTAAAAPCTLACVAAAVANQVAAAAASEIADAGVCAQRMQQLNGL